jgi:NADH-quinone oxidoreductase subunit N
MYLVASAVNAGQIALAVIIVVNSAIAAYYYLRPVSYMFLRDSEVGIKNTTFMQNATLPVKSVVGFAVFLTLISILLIEPLLNIISAYVASSGF